jgi:hypothetical protein
VRAALVPTRRESSGAGWPDDEDGYWLPVVWAGAGLVPWPVAFELPVPPAEMPVGVVLVALVAVPMVPDSDVPVELEPELVDIAPDEELPLALLLSLPLVPVELHAARDMAIRPPIRRAWYFFMLTPFVKVTPSWGHTFAFEIG